LLRRIYDEPVGKAERVRMLGVDDLDFRKGQRYGTILVDLERHRVIDSLPDREGSTLEGWLKSHPEVDVMDISNFQLDSVIGPPTENPCVGGSIPSLAINRIKKLRPPHRWPFSFTYAFTHAFDSGIFFECQNIYPTARL
jgi:hypothetical protein